MVACAVAMDAETATEVRATITAATLPVMADGVAAAAPAALTATRTAAIAILRVVLPQLVPAYAAVVLRTVVFAAPTATWA